MVRSCLCTSVKTCSCMLVMELNNASQAEAVLVVCRTERHVQCSVRAT